MRWVRHISAGMLLSATALTPLWAQDITLTLGHVPLPNTSYQAAAERFAGGALFAQMMGAVETAPGVKYLGYVRGPPAAHRDHGGHPCRYA